jgi:hypothetical protein
MDALQARQQQTPYRLRSGSIVLPKRQNYELSFNQNISYGSADTMIMD